ncbi:MAG: chromate transporter, partial [Rhodoferax sp.]|nr:chromate transporter [Rhodoferax sp.]
PNVINLALMLGGRYFGVRGAFVAMAGMLLFPLCVVVLLAVAFAGVADLAAAQGALRGMGAVAAGLITATGLRLLPALRRNAMGPLMCWIAAGATFIAVAWLRLPLAWLLLSLGGLCCLWAWYRLGAASAQQIGGPPA